MKGIKRIPRRLAALLCTLSLLLTLSPAAFAAETPYVSNNINLHHLDRIVSSYLYANAQGGLTRVEIVFGKEDWQLQGNVMVMVGYQPGKVVVEDYNSAYQLVSKRIIPEELSGCWGFFAGETYNFLIFGQGNPNESDALEVIRVVKYSKDWKRLGQASIKDVNVKTPFYHGAVRCAEAGGELFIHTARAMYRSENGLCHQSNLTFIVNENSMSYQPLSNGYVSHSFDQYVTVDREGNLVMLDLGDAHPRAVALYKYNRKTGGKQVIIEEIPGKIGNASTGVNLGGLAETASGYVTAFDHGDLLKNAGKNAMFGGQSNAYLSYTDKTTLTTKITRLTAAPGISGAALASTGLEGGFVMWNTRTGSNSMKNNVDEILYYVPYTSDGTAGTVKTGSAPLSDCALILYNGRLVWYVTDNSAPKFYGLDGNGVQLLTAKSGPSAAPLKDSRSAPLPAATNSQTPAASGTAPNTSSNPGPSRTPLYCHFCGESDEGTLSGAYNDAGTKYVCVDCWLSIKPAIVDAYLGS